MNEREKTMFGMFLFGLGVGWFIGFWVGWSL